MTTTPVANEKPSCELKFRIGSLQARLFQNVDFYLANNLYQIYIVDNKQTDPDFKLIAWLDHIEDGKGKQELSFRNTLHAGCKIKPSISLDNLAFRFSYKGNIIDCRCKWEGNKETIPFVTHEHMEHKELTFEFMDAAGLAVLPQFLSATVEYTSKYIDNFDMDGNKVTIYCNDEGYWEKVHDRRHRSMSTIYLPKADKDGVIADIERFLKPETIDRYHEIGRTHKRVYLFEGIPGGGKTSFIVALASKFKYDIAIISFTDKVTDGGLIRLIKNLPDRTFLVMEDIDVLFSDRKKNDEHKNSVTFSGILNNLDGVTTKDGFICFMTTNYKNHLDHALLRPGRVDYQLKFEPANKEQIHDIFERYMGAKFVEPLFKQFYSAFNGLGFQVSMSLMQEYLFKYLDEPELAIANIDEMRELNEYTKMLGTGAMFT